MFRFIYNHLSELEIKSEGEGTVTRIAIHHCLVRVLLPAHAESEKIDIVTDKIDTHPPHLHPRYHFLRQAVAQCDIGNVKIGPVVEITRGCHLALSRDLGNLRQQ